MSTNIYTIYKATNMITGKSYIGITNNYARRLNSHRHAKDPYYFHTAIRKHGFESFIWEILYQSKDEFHTLHEMEPYFIQEYDSYQNGYNLTLGGDGSYGWKPSEKTKRKISKANKGRFLGKTYEEIYGESAGRLRESRRMVALGKDNSGRKNPMFGKNHSEESILLMSEAHKGENHPQYGFRWITDGKSNKKINPKLESFQNPWKFGRTRQKKA